MAQGLAPLLPVWETQMQPGPALAPGAIWGDSGWKICHSSRHLRHFAFRIHTVGTTMETTKAQRDSRTGASGRKTATQALGALTAETGDSCVGGFFGDVKGMQARRESPAAEPALVC